LQLSETRYKTWQWNYGYSPSYTFQVNIPLRSGILPVNIKVENGKFVQIEMPVETIINSLTQLLNSLTGILHNEEDIDKILERARTVVHGNDASAISNTFSKASFTATTATPELDVNDPSNFKN